MTRTMIQRSPQRASDGGRQRAIMSDKEAWTRREEGKANGEANGDVKGDEERWRDEGRSEGR